MKFLGIDFVPLNEPLHKRLETFWMGFWFAQMFLGCFIFIPLLIYLLFTSYWWVTAGMAIWIYIDRETCEKGGRHNCWVRSWSCWRHIMNYHNAELLLDEGFSLDPNQNYIFASFPHGIIPMGPYVNLQVPTSPFLRLYPNMTVKLTTLKMNFMFPISRECMLLTGFVSCSSKSLNHLLTRAGKGNVVVVMVGGVQEALKTTPGQYKFVVKNRKGFVKMALKHGVSIVPVVTFGENDIYEHIDIPVFRSFQRLVKKHSGFAPILFNGRGFFQCSFGALPKITPLFTVLGKPIEIPKVEDPTNEEIDDIHSKFVTRLEDLFQRYKYRCIENAENVDLQLF